MDLPKNRVGETQVTSVSVSKEFAQVIKNNKLSPTEIFRKGLAVTLCELGIAPYSNPLNEQRLKLIKNFLTVNKYEEMVEEIGNLHYKLKELIAEDKDGC